MYYTIVKANSDVPLPGHLLLLADENEDLVATYLPRCQPYLLLTGEQVVGVCLVETTGRMAEVMNIAVEPQYQGKGLGKALLTEVIERSREAGLERLMIKTANSSISQLALYQQLGFELVSVNYNYFLNAYPQPIWENKIRAKHQLVLERVL